MQNPIPNTVLENYISKLALVLEEALKCRFVVEGVCSESGVNADVDAVWSLYLNELNRDVVEPMLKILKDTEVGMPEIALIILHLLEVLSKQISEKKEEDKNKFVIYSPKGGTA